LLPKQAWQDIKSLCSCKSLRAWSEDAMGRNDLSKIASATPNKWQEHKLECKWFRGYDVTGESDVEEMRSTQLHLAMTPTPAAKSALGVLLIQMQATGFILHNFLRRLCLFLRFHHTFHHGRLRSLRSNHNELLRTCRSTSETASLSDA
jgi:hypothetical protein